jgi:putative glycerol-1-phosphate prenyltransferase
MRWFSQTKSLFILIDPENEFDMLLWAKKSELIEANRNITGILLGGSTLSKDYGLDIIDTFKAHSSKPIIGFPGSSEQIYPSLDSILFLNYLNSDHSKFTRLEPIDAGKIIDKLKIPSIPCAYIIVNEISDSTTLKITNSLAFNPKTDKENILSRISFAWHSGQKHLYLEAGSGSKSSMEVDLIKTVKSKFDFHIIVGGGVRTKKQIETLLKSGADTVVVGTAVEENINLLKSL